MKKCVTVLVCLLLVAILLPLSRYTASADDRYLEINTDSFPDDNFRDWIIQNLSVCGDPSSGYYMTKEQVDSVYQIDISSKVIGDQHVDTLKGIEYFTNLQELKCYNIGLTELDVRMNTKLILLWCDGNPLKSIDVSHNVYLKELGCEQTQLTELDISNNTALTYLSCNDNQLTELDLSKNTALNSLWCANNHISCLALDNNVSITMLSCEKNMLSELNVSNLTMLTLLYCSGNQLKALNVNNNKALEELDCDDNALTELNVDQNAKLTELSCANNRLTFLRLSNNPLLVSLDCNNNQLAALDLSSNTALKYIDCRDNQLSVLNLENVLPHILYCSNNHLAVIDISAVDSVTWHNDDFELADISPQTILDQHGNTDSGIYTYDMTRIMPLSLIENVKLLNQAYDLDYATGTVRFDAPVNCFKYEYFLMEVTVYLSFDTSPAFDGTIEWNSDDVTFNGTTPYIVANGQAHKPRFTVKAKDGSVIAASHYTYEYLENTNAGTGYVIVTFKDTYSGMVRGWFKIYLPPTTETTVENRDDGIYIEWHAVPGAAGYVIYRRAWSSTTSGTWTPFVRWNNTTELHWTDKTVYAGTRYQYGIKAYFAPRVDPVTGATIGGNVGDNYNLGRVGPLKTTVRITTRKLNSVTGGTKQITAKWSGSSVFIGYQVQVATDKAFKNIVKTVKIAKSNVYQTTVKNLNAKTTYYVRVRSYHVFEGMTYYGGWSNVLSGKTK